MRVRELSFTGPDIADQIVKINDDDAIANAKRLAREEGIFVGISAGATLAAALKIAESAQDKSTFCVMLPDTGERYLSTPLFADISEESDEEKLDSLYRA